MKVGIVGGGTVGQATARSYLEHVEEVRVYDLLPERRTDDLRRVLECDIVFLCLPTPQQEGGLACDTSAVDGFLANRADVRIWDKANFVLRSTVPVGYTRQAQERYGLPNLVHSPEFLTARCALTDAQMPARNIVGIPDKPVGNWFTLRDSEKMTPGGNLFAMYKQRWPHVPVHIMSSDESEAVKLFTNAFFAVKVAYWNEVRTLADRLGLDWQRVLNAVLADGRIHPSHSQVPGPDGRFGFGGTCLPKDLANLICGINHANLVPYVTEAALRRNIEVDRQREVPK